MSITKKGSRKITVNDIEYRWSIRKKPTYAEAVNDFNLSAVVELYDNPRSKLMITFPFVRPDSWISPNNNAVKPSDIENCIRKSIKLGWVPSSKEKPFQLILENEKDI